MAQRDDNGDDGDDKNHRLHSYNVSEVVAYDRSSDK